MHGNSEFEFLHWVIQKWEKFSSWDIVELRWNMFVRMQISNIFRICQQNHVYQRITKQAETNNNEWRAGINIFAERIFFAHFYQFKFVQINNFPEFDIVHDQDEQQLHTKNLTSNTLMNYHRIMLPKTCIRCTNN